MNTRESDFEEIRAKSYVFRAISRKRVARAGNFFDCNQNATETTNVIGVELRIYRNEIGVDFSKSCKSCKKFIDENVLFRGPHGSEWRCQNSLSCKACSAR